MHNQSDKKHYWLYGYCIETNRHLDILKTVESENTKFPKMKLNVFIDEEPLFMENKVGYRFISDNIIELIIGSDIKYDISLNENRIDVYARNYDVVRSTIINLPFALFFMYRDFLLLHASAVLINGKLLAFSGNKGAGKTTLVSRLCGKHKLFSDDTILVKRNEDGQMYYCPGLQKMKMTKEMYNLYVPTDDEFDSYPKDLQGKAIVETDNAMSIESFSHTIELIGICVIRRTNTNKISISHVKNFFSKTLLLHSCVPGVNLLGLEYNKRIERNSIYKTILDTISLYQLCIPDNLNELDNTVDYIESVFG